MRHKFNGDHTSHRENSLPGKAHPIMLLHTEKYFLRACWKHVVRERIETFTF